MAANTDKFRKAYNSAEPNVARVSSTRAVSATTLSCDNLTGWPTDTAVDFVTYQLDSSNEVVSGSLTVWQGVVSGNTITSLDRTSGAADAGNAINDVVEMVPTGHGLTKLVEGILVHADQDGTLKAGAVDVAAVLASDVVETTKIKDGNVTTSKLAEGAVTNAKLDTTAGGPGGAWASWTPTLSGITQGNGTVEAKYTQIGKTVHFRFVFTFGSTSSISTGVISAPVTADAGWDNFEYVGFVRSFDFSGGSPNHVGFCRMESTTTIRPIQTTSSSNYTAEQGFSSTIPFTWATGDQLVMTGTYEAV